jgi:hypothetical protein
MILADEASFFAVGLFKNMMALEHACIGYTTVGASGLCRA